MSVEFKETLKDVSVIAGCVVVFWAVKFLHLI